MSEHATQTALEEELARLRREFDASFAEASQPAQTLVDVIVLRAVGTTLAVLRRDVAAIVSEFRVVPLPGAPGAEGRRNGPIGICYVRGQVVAVHPLGTPRESRSTPKEHRLLLLSASEPSIGFAFDELIGLVRVTMNALQSDPSDSRTTSTTWLHMDDCVLPLIDLGAFLDALMADAVDAAGTNDVVAQSKKET
jgi:chemotaxis signal transduction protein